LGEKQTAADGMYSPSLTKTAVTLTLWACFLISGTTLPKRLAHYLKYVSW